MPGTTILYVFLINVCYQMYIDKPFSHSISISPFSSSMTEVEIFITLDSLQQTKP